jgi:hypothetical protein
MEELRLRFKQRLRATSMPDRSFNNTAETEAAVRQLLWPTPLMQGLPSPCEQVRLINASAMMNFDFEL